MKKPRRFFPWLRTAWGIRQELKAIRLQLTRLADIHEAQYTGVAPAALTLPEPPEEPLALALGNDLDYARGYEVEQRLARQLGRAPTAEEICQEIDGIEWDPLQPTVVVGRRQPERRVN